MNGFLYSVKFCNGDSNFDGFGLSDAETNGGCGKLRCCGQEIDVFKVKLSDCFGNCAMEPEVWG